MSTVTARGPLRARAALAFALTAAACGGDGDGPTAPGSGGGPGVLRLRNTTNTPVWYVYVRGCDGGAWGSDRLGDEVIMPDETERVQVGAGCRDVRFESSPQNGHSHERRGVQVGAQNGAELVLSTW